MLAAALCRFDRNVRVALSACHAMPCRLLKSEHSGHANQIFSSAPLGSPYPYTDRRHAIAFRFDSSSPSPSPRPIDDRSLNNNESSSSINSCAGRITDKDHAHRCHARSGRVFLPNGRPLVSKDIDRPRKVGQASVRGRISPVQSMHQSISVSVVRLPPFPSGHQQGETKRPARATGGWE
jgi:hypothetical protein